MQAELMKFALDTVVFLLRRIFHSNAESVCVCVRACARAVRSEVLLSLVFVSLGIQTAFCTYCLQSRMGHAFNTSAKWKMLSLRLLTCEHCS